MKNKGKGRDRKELRQYYGLPKDCKNSAMDGFRRKESRLLKDQGSKMLEHLSAGAEIQEIQRLNSKRGEWKVHVEHESIF